METKKIAVDIALIPPKQILDLAMQLNQSFPDTAKEDYVLDAKTCVPHITLLMGLISRDQVAKVSAKLKSIAEKTPALDLHTIGITASPIPDGKMFSTLVIENTPALQKLHGTILEKLSPSLSWDDVKTDMFFSPPPVREISTFWVSGFVKNSTRENYKPHISLGFGEVNQKFVPIQFTVPTLALFHLGNYCTCRNKLNSFPLKVRGVEGVSAL